MRGEISNEQMEMTRGQRHQILGLLCIIASMVAQEVPFAVVVFGVVGIGYLLVSFFESIFEK